jgi:phosphoribosylaminoimidazole-succinocarboxamide synthase
MINETEMREIFRELSLQNQANLTIYARKYGIIQKDKKNEKALVNDGNIGLYAGIRDKNGARIKGEP